jgi:hypothetical protein
MHWATAKPKTIEISGFGTELGSRFTKLYHPCASQLSRMKFEAGNRVQKAERWSIDWPAAPSNITGG